MEAFGLSVFAGALVVGVETVVLVPVYASDVRVLVSDIHHWALHCLSIFLIKLLVEIVLMGEDVAGRARDP